MSLTVALLAAVAAAGVEAVAGALLAAPLAVARLLVVATAVVAAAADATAADVDAAAPLVLPEPVPPAPDHGVAGRALPAIPLGLIAGVGSAGAQRLAMPRAFVRADPADPTPGAHARRLVREAARQCAADEVLVLDAGFGVALLQEEGTPRYVVRLAKNATFRRAVPPPSSGRGDRHNLGELRGHLPCRCVRAQSRIPAREGCLQIVVEHARPHLKQQMRSPRRPAHLLPFHQALAQDLIDR